LNVSRCACRYQARKKIDDRQIEQMLRQLAERKPRWGYGKMIDYLRNHGYGWNHKRIYRVYCELALNLRRKPKKRLPARAARFLTQPEKANQSWSLDFMSDSLASDRAIRTLNILDDFNREVLWIEVDTSLPAARVIRVLDMLLLWRGAPKQIRMDNDPELILYLLERWATEHGVELAHIQPGKPSQNAYIERFNRTFREDVLDAYLFHSLEEVRRIVELWIEEYNTVRPHDALQGMTPFQFAAQHA
jgi:putative transposase